MTIRSPHFGSYLPHLLRFSKWQGPDRPGSRLHYGVLGQFLELSQVPRPLGSLRVISYHSFSSLSRQFISL